MVIHRPDWERSSKLVAWTRGREDALIRFTAPTKDAGNATLKQGQQMWTFTPKLNRVIRLPFSMMSQGWAGSDFSYSDLSRTDQLLHEYELSLVGTETRDGHQVYTVDAVPHDDAPVVWGKEQIVLRDDYVLLGQTFFDQAMKPLKRLESREIKTLGGRTFATRMRMVPLDKTDEWTEIAYDQAQFDIKIDDGMFTVFALQSGPQPMNVGVASSAMPRRERATTDLGLSGAIAWRNLWRNRKRTLLSAGAIAFSVALLTFAMSMQAGTYATMVDNATRLLDGHIQLQRRGYLDDPRIESAIDSAADRVAKVRAVPGVVAAAPRIAAFALVSGNDRSYGAQLLGVDPAGRARVVESARHAGRGAIHRRRRGSVCRAGAGPQSRGFGRRSDRRARHRVERWSGSAGA